MAYPRGRARAVLATLVLCVPIWCWGVAPTLAACPQSATFVAASDGSTVDIGWTGLGHGLELAPMRFAVGLGPCASRSDGGCGVCPITGLADSNLTRRCSSDTSRACKTSADCENAGECLALLAPPMPVSAGGVGWCLLPAVESQVHGGIDVTEGTIALDLPLALQSFQGPPAAPCPLCTGDHAADDGKRDGVCDGGARAKQPCDASGDAPSHKGAPSLDCPPAAEAAFGSLTARTLELSSGTRSRTVDISSPDAKVHGRRQARSLCDVCDNDPKRPCASAADCEDDGACGGITGAPTAPNACDDGICSSSDGIHGVCNSGPFDRTCVGRSDRRCLTDDECGAGGRCQTSPRKCFPGGGNVGDAVAARGTVGKPRENRMQSTLATLFCVAPGRDAAANQLFGLPGLGRLLLSGTWILRTESVEVLP